MKEAPGLHSWRSAQTGGHGTALAQGHPAVTGASTGCCDGLVKGSGCFCPWAAHYLIPCSEAGSQSQWQPELTPNPVHSTAASALARCGCATTWGCAPRTGSVTAGLIPVLLPPARALLTVPYAPGELGANLSQGQGLKAGDLPQKPSQ